MILTRSKGRWTVTVREAAIHACVCESIVRSWVASGQLPHSRIGTLGKRGKIVIAKEDLDGFLANFKVAKKSPVPAKSKTVRKSTFQHLKFT
jgi:hypothetical protein